MFSKTGISGRVGIIAAGFFFLISTGIFSQNQNHDELPGWILYEKGLLLYEQGQLSDALEMFILSAKGGELTSEALYQVGRIYEAEGDYLLARKRYEEALEKARFLYVPDQKWDIYYSMADLYLNEKDYDQYEQTLLSVFDHEMKRNTEIIRKEHSYVQVLKSEGIDKLLLLYRLELRYSLEATSRLGQYYNGIELWKSSLIKNLYPLLTIMSRGIEALIADNPDFSFPVDMEEAWENDPEFLISSYEDICADLGIPFSFQRDLISLEVLDPLKDSQTASELIQKVFPGFYMSPAVYTLLALEKNGKIAPGDEMLYSSLYFLAESLYQEGSTERALEIWSLLKMSSRDTSWRTLAGRKITNPDLKTPFLKY